MKIESETKEKESDKTTKKENEKSSRKSPNFFINYKDLFLIQEPVLSKEKEEKKEKEDITLKKKKNEEDLSYLKQLYTFPEITNDSFKNKEYKFVLQSNKNIRFHDEYTAKYIGKGVSKIDYGTVQTEKEITNTRPIFYFEVFIKDDGKDCDIWIGIGEKEITEKCLSLGSTSRSYGYHSKSKSHNNKKEIDNNKDNKVKQYFNKIEENIKNENAYEIKNTKQQNNNNSKQNIIVENVNNIMKVNTKEKDKKINHLTNKIEKINSRFEFPKKLNLKNYCVENVLNIEDEMNDIYKKKR